MTDAPHITVAYGDGIGPEIMEATLAILREGGAKLQIDSIEIGEKFTPKAFRQAFRRLRGKPCAAIKSC